MNEVSEKHSAEPPASRPRGFGTFATVWFGQLVSLVGSGVTRFAIGVWVFQRSGSVTQFALISMFASLPGLLASPFAGAIVDRLDRRRIMIVADTGAAITTLVLALLLWRDALEIWHIYLLASIASLFETFQMPAYLASTTLLVPKRHLGRISGMIQLGRAAANTVAPATAGVLIVWIGLRGILWFDFATFLFALLTLLLVHIPRPPTSADGQANRGSIGSEALFGWRFIRERPGLLGLLFYFAILNLVLAMAMVLVVPMVLAFSSETVLGTVMAMANAGLVIGSVVMTATGGPKHRVSGILFGGLLFGFALFFVGYRPNASLVGTAMFFMMFGFPIINSCSQAIWQSKVPPDVQGRVFAVRRMVAQVTGPIGYLLAGPLADRVFEPLMSEAGLLADSLGPHFGTGPGRGIGLQLTLMAVLPILGALWVFARPHIHRVEKELPDAI